MKRFAVLASAVVLCVLFAGASFALAAEKFGYVELGRVLNDYNKTKDYDKVLADKQADYEAERGKKVNDLKQFQDKFNLLSDKEKEAKKGEFDSKIKALQEFDRQKQTDLRKEFNDKKTEIAKDVEAAISKYAEKEGYTLVFSEGGVAYNVKSLDITDKVLAELNKNYKK